MALNIKDEKVHDLVRELARQNGTSQTEAVRVAVELQLRRLRREKATKEWSDRIKETAKLFPEGFDSTTATDFLYDEYGLPK
ncbi:hypothetical protein BH09CHL1_BH09CHL1_24870 [soil metagenome]